MKGKILRCIQCNELVNNTEYDSMPEYYYHEEGKNFVERPRDDRKTFELRHNGHQIEELTVVDGSFISQWPYLEPVKEGYFQVTNGKERFLVRKWRESIDNPISYQLIDGYIEITNTQLEVQRQDIRRQMRAEIPSISDRKIDQFIQVVEDVASQLDWKKLEVSAEGENPLITYYKLGDHSMGNILSRSTEIFNSKEFKKIKEFIYQNNGHNDVMTLRVRRRFKIVTTDKTKRTNSHL
ncbi:MAG TPA: hypothetical protein EYP21_04085 [Syntrophaceae bacterium]|nr:hypothetical protein [Syntrophaceae bacterium]